MKSRMEIAKDILGNRSSASAGYRPGATSSSVGPVTGGGTSASGSATLRQARVESINEDGTVTLTMLDTGDQVRVMTTTPVSVGQIVNVLKQGSNVVVYSLEGVVGQQVTAVMTQYAGSDSESEPPAETAMWASVWPEGYDYVWQRVVTEYKDGTRSISEVTCISRPSDGADLSGVVTDVKIQYAGNNNPASAPVSGWSDEMPTGYECVWQRTSTTYGDGHVENSTPALIKQDTDEDQMQTVYATCSTSASTASKVATVQSGTMSLVEGAVVQVTFTYQNTASSPTLNVGGTGARSIRTLGTPYLPEHGVQPDPQRRRHGRALHPHARHPVRLLGGWSDRPLRLRRHVLADGERPGLREHHHGRQPAGQQRVHQLQRHLPARLVGEPRCRAARPNRPRSGLGRF